MSEIHTNTKSLQVKRNIALKVIVTETFQKQLIFEINNTIESLNQKNNTLYF